MFMELEDGGTTIEKKQISRVSAPVAAEECQNCIHACVCKYCNLIKEIEERGLSMCGEDKYENMFTMNVLCSMKRGRGRFGRKPRV